jgi:predicted GIY-YIG superfamily endonuclease
MSQPIYNLDPMWKYVTDQVKAKISMPAVWRAMEAAKPLTLNGDELILGFEAAEMHQSGLLLDHRHKNVIEQIIEAATRRRLKLRIITGQTLEDWEMAYQAEIEGARLQQQTKEQFLKTAEAGQTWDAVSEHLVRRLSATQNRGLASVQGRFLEEVVSTYVEAYGRLMPPAPAEQDERNYSRALERMAERIGVPAPLIAHLVDLRRK